MISLQSFSGYDNFAHSDLEAGVASTESHAQDFEKDLAVIHDFSSRLIKQILWDMNEYLDGNFQVPISNDGKHLSRCFDFTDDADDDGRTLDYDGSVILETTEPLPANKQSVFLKDFQYYTIKLESDGNQAQSPKTIFIKGALTKEGKYEDSGLEQFSLTNFNPEDAGEDAVIGYTNSQNFIQKNFGKELPKEQDASGGAFIFDLEIDRPCANFQDSDNAKQVLLLKSGFAIRTV